MGRTADRLLHQLRRLELPNDTLPLHLPGVEAHEVDPWQENGETWRRLQVTFPRTIATHNAHQVFYFDADHMLRRLDYNPHITGAAPIAHYVADHKEFGGFLFPTQRRVYLRDGNGVADKTRALITIAIDDVAIS